MDVGATVHTFPFFAAEDPFLQRQEGGTSHEGLIHIRIQQRNGRKTLTTVQGIAEMYDKKKLVKVCKKVSRSWLSPLVWEE